MLDTGSRQRIVFQIFPETFPAEPLALAATIQPFSGQSQGSAIKPFDSSPVAADTIVLIVSSELGCQGRPPLLCFLVVAYLPEPVVHLFAFLSKLLPARLSAHQKITPATFSAEMGKSQKVEGVGLASLSSRVLRFVPAETEGSRLLGMKFQSELREPFP